MSRYRLRRFLRDTWAVAVRKWPPSDNRAAEGRYLLRQAGLYKMADCLHADPYATARALADRYKSPTSKQSPQQEA